MTSIRCSTHKSKSACRFGMALLAALQAIAQPLFASTITLDNGLQLVGRVAEIQSVGAGGIQRGDPNLAIKEIYVVDDGLRRVFVPEKKVRNNVPKDEKLETIRIDYNRTPPAGQGRMVASVGSILKVTPFDEYGRRIFSIAGPQGRLDIIQGITEINSRYCKVEGLQTVRNPYTWDMRVATSSIPRSVLSQVIMRQIDPKDPDERLKLFRLYTEAEMYRDAASELSQILSDFPELKRRLGAQSQSLNQLRANRLVRELERFSDSGQHGFAYAMLKGFRSKGVAAETLLKVGDMVGEYDRKFQQRDKVLELLEQQVGELKSPDVERDIAKTVREIKDELNVHNLARLAPFLRLADDPSLKPAQKVSLALSGWLMGANAAQENMAESIGLCQGKPLVRQYLQTVHPHEREAALAQLKLLEGMSPKNMAAILQTMKPASSVDGVKELGPNFYEVTIPGPQGEANITYLVQLPPEYSPHRKYPCVMTLHGGTTAEMQVDWWAGGRSKSSTRRSGQATRFGYIVVAPKWTKAHQRKYEYSFREHAIALLSIRDACKRLSIDTDRVFLSGHSMGGDAAWDIGLAHPDLWAGVIPIAASAGKYVSRYWRNAKGLPLYFVTGDMDAGRASDNIREWDRYLTKPGFDCVVAEYQGRSHEAFPDDIQNIFQWMQLQKRDFARTEIDVVTMRDWDNFFWFLELDNLPANSMVAPAAWPQPKVREAPFQAKILNNRVILERCRTGRASIFLSPDWIDFSRPARVTLRTRNLGEPKPDIGVMLEDVRTRGDRFHPFWAVVQARLQ